MYVRTCVCTHWHLSVCMWLHVCAGSKVANGRRSCVFIWVFLCCSCIQEDSSMCDWCWLVKTVCTYLPCGHVIGRCVQVCGVFSVHVHACMRTPDASHITSSSCRDWLWLRLDRHNCKNLMLECFSRRSTFCRCCAVATLEATLPQSSVVGYKSKTIQWLVLSKQVETPAYCLALFPGHVR